MDKGNFFVRRPIVAMVIAIVTVIVGAVLSDIVSVAVVVLLLPQSSVAVKVITALPVAPHSSIVNGS